MATPSVLKSRHDFFASATGGCAAGSDGTFLFRTRAWNNRKKSRFQALHIYICPRKKLTTHKVAGGLVNTPHTHPTMNHADITRLRNQRANYHKTYLQYCRPYAGARGGCISHWCYLSDDLPVYGRAHAIEYQVSRWERAALVFLRPRLYARYDLSREYVYSTDDIKTICLRRVPDTSRERERLWRDIAWLVYDNECKKWRGLCARADVAEIDAVLGVSRDMTLDEYAGALSNACNKYYRCDVSGSKSRARHIILCIMRSIDDKIAHCQTVVRPFGVGGDNIPTISSGAF